MVKFKLKGNKNASWGVRINGNKVHLSGDREYDSDLINKAKTDWNDLKRQLGETIIWSNETTEIKA